MGREIFVNIGMQRYYGKDVIIILDEYDTPMQEAWLSGYWDDAALFSAASLTAPLKQTLIFTGV